MNCPRCGSVVASKKNTCDVCGCSLGVYRKIVRLSNSFYNRGLEQAKVRDLSGAVLSLKKSLEINKRNTDARNLLGLVYYELGETVAALTQWVISKNFQQQDNDADYFMERVQSDSAELDNISQAIHKYNQALSDAKRGNEDLAALQLKKVVGMHPRFVKAHQLLALLLMRDGQYDKAKKYLLKAAKTDVTNTITLRYLAEIDKELSPQERSDSNVWDKPSDERKESSGRGIAFKSSYKEDKPNVMVFVNLLIGVLIGIAVVYYLIVPTIESNIREEYDAQKVDYSTELSSKTATITQQEKSIANLEKQIADQQAELESISREPVTIEVGAEEYENFFDIWAEYQTLKSNVYSDEELVKLALNLWEFDSQKIESDSAQRILSTMREEIYPLAARKVYKAGRNEFDAENYDEAARLLRAAVDFTPDSDAAMYYLGKSLQAQENFEEAVYYYKLMLEVCPNSTLKEYIPQRLSECNVTEDE